PDRIPRWIAIVLIAADASGIHLEPHRIYAVVIRIEHDDQLVGRERVEGAVVTVGIEELIAPRYRCTNPACTEAVEHSRADVQSALVEQYAHFGALARWRSFVWLLLPEIRDRSRSRPCRFVQLAVDVDRSG